MNRSDFDFELPPEQVASRPATERDGSRLLVLDRATGRRTHRRFREITEVLRAGDLLVFNDSRVIPARLWARKADTGGRVELLLVESASGSGPTSPREPHRWWALARSSKGLREGQALELEAQPGARVWVDGVQGKQVRVASEADLLQVALRHGQMPLPPYIGRDADPEDAKRYQTVYAKELGSVAAPTAGLHFTESLLERLRDLGVEQAFLTLHVGPGTFLPVESERIEAHRMHAERFVLPPPVVDAIHRTRRRGGRVFAVGTTVTRVLESFDAQLEPGPGSTSLFIRPGHRFRWVDALVTNFHLPQSTLLMLVAAFAGRDLVLDTYREAVREGYRFYSYGDSMCIL